MRWRDERQSENVEDRRGMSGGKIAIGGLGGIVVLVIALLFGADPRQLSDERNCPSGARHIIHERPENVGPSLVSCRRGRK